MFRSHKGFVLVTVLIVTAIGLLFGAGALMLFRYQCQLRIDRQHELEKVYAVRSALNYLRSETVTDANGEEFRYHTGSDRDLSLIIKPAKTIFPTNCVQTKTNVKRHFDMRQGDFTVSSTQPGVLYGYNDDLDYEYGAEGVTNLSETMYGVSGYAAGLYFNFTNVTEKGATRCWVNIGMRDTGGWLQEEYGRRYAFYAEKFVSNDVARLWLIRAPSNTVNGTSGQHYGWPPSGNERSLMLELEKVSSEGMEMKLWECVGTTKAGPCLCSLLAVGESNVGIQLAHNKASLYYIQNDGILGLLQTDILLRGFIFSNTATLSSLTYKHFYTGSITNSVGKIVEAPDIRAVFEIIPASTPNAGGVRHLADFMVVPGYQYDIYVKNKKLAGDPVLATVAQRMGTYARSGEGSDSSGAMAGGGSSLLYSILTYDTHGTEHKGFRYDERHPNGN